MALKWYDYDILNRLALGLVYFHQGRIDESRQSIEKASAWERGLTLHPDRPVSVAVTDWLEYNILLRESEATIEGKSRP